MRRYGHVSLRKNSIIFFPSTHTNESFMKVHVRQAMRRERAERRGNKGKKAQRKSCFLARKIFLFCIPSSVRELSSYSLERILVRILCALAVIVPV